MIESRPRNAFSKEELLEDCSFHCGRSFCLKCVDSSRQGSFLNHFRICSTTPHNEYRLRLHRCKSRRKNCQHCLATRNPLCSIETLIHSVQYATHSGTLSVGRFHDHLPVNNYSLTQHISLIFNTLIFVFHLSGYYVNLLSTNSNCVSQRGKVCSNFNWNVP